MNHPQLHRYLITQIENNFHIMDDDELKKLFKKLLWNIFSFLEGAQLEEEFQILHSYEVALSIRKVWIIPCANKYYTLHNLTNNPYYGRLSAYIQDLEYDNWNDLGDYCQTCGRLECLENCELP